MRPFGYGVFIVIYYCLRAIFILPQSSHFYIAFLNVGQGDAFVINIPMQGQILVDTGFSYQSNYLSARSSVFPICRLRSVVVTHSDFDHSGGLSRVSTYCKNLRIYDNLSKDDVLVFNDVRLTVLSPRVKGSSHEENDDSIVMLLTRSDFSALLPGDAGLDVLKQLPLEELVGVDVYKVSHHGSRYNNSFDFIDQLRPRYCVISVGKNTFGHPAREVLGDLARAGCKVFRTDLNGTIMLY